MNFIGEGSFGKVQLGKHKLTGEKVAIKVISKSSFRGKDDVKRLNREV
jgi:serine/threonine protein kinase